MRYRRLAYRYTMVVTTGSAESPADAWWMAGPRVILTHPRWRPATDVYETAEALVVTVELAGVSEEEMEMHLYEDALVVEGRRDIPGCQEAERYHAFGIRQGPFRVEVSLPVPIEADSVEARYERGLLRIWLPKPTGGKAHGRNA